MIISCHLSALCFVAFEQIGDIILYAVYSYNQGNDKIAAKRCIKVVGRGPTAKSRAPNKLNILPILPLSYPYHLPPNIRRLTGRLGRPPKKSGALVIL